MIYHYLTIFCHTGTYAQKTARRICYFLGILHVTFFPKWCIMLKGTYVQTYVQY